MLMQDRVKEFLKKKLTKQFIATQTADAVIAVVIFMALSGAVKMIYCFLAVGIYAVIALAVCAIRIVRKIKKGK